jgi:DNA-binding XRE family transcriptional regulator
MTKESFTQTISQSIRLIRNEYHLSQDVFSDMIGITKKTLVQIEKDRSFASWSVVIAIVMLFKDSQILKMVLSDDPALVLRSIVFDSVDLPKSQSMGGKMFWRTLRTDSGFKIQQNYFSGHYRVIDGLGRRFISSYEKSRVETWLDAIKSKESHDEKEVE